MNKIKEIINKGKCICLIGFKFGNNYKFNLNQIYDYYTYTTTTIDGDTIYEVYTDFYKIYYSFNGLLFDHYFIDASEYRNKLIKEILYD